ncbi:MAG: uncharacterized protein KVP18_001167 [Porospora cf. gigantea A]|uniref:uncharacterized protein n=1 Tax=Porospora cf. gigantea A TaxID=2853593 RepID=UPI0035598611|nr:MAG: hypothetical protein KVP18_001167 [Porospora cf. gigantea A]
MTTLLQGAPSDCAEYGVADHEQVDEKSEVDVNLLLDGLKTNLVCSTLKEAELQSLIAAMKSYVFSAGEIVFNEGDPGSYFFTVKQGAAVITENGVKKDELTRGRTFGEIALIHDAVRTTTVTAGRAGLTAWAVTRVVFRSILQQMSAKTYAENRTFLDSVKLFEMLTEAQRSMITNALLTETIEADHDIVTQGQPGDVLYILKEGTAKVMIKNQVVRELVKGDYFGERALLYDEPRSATVRAVVTTTCLGVGRVHLDNVLGNLQHVLFRNVMLQALQQSPTLRQFSEKQLATLMAGVVVKDYPENFTIVNRISNGKLTRQKDLACIIVLEGSVLISLRGKKVTILERGGFFGEQYVKQHLQTNFMHRVDSITVSKVALLASSALVACLGDVGSALETNNKLLVLKKMFIFRYLSTDQSERLIQAFQDVTYTKGEEIIREGETGTRFFIIKNGEAVVTKGGKRIRTSGKYDYFGERALLYDEPRSASIDALSEELHVWVVDKATFLSIMEGPMLSHLEERIRLQDTQVEVKDLTLMGVVGEGTFGVVRLVRHKRTGHHYALKAVSRSVVVKLNQQEHIRTEREILAENDHPFIIKLVRTFKDANFLYFLTELSTGGELYEAIRSLGLLNRAQGQFYMASIIVAMEYLHEKKVVYRDLKPENILLDSQGYIKLIDFGCAKKVSGRTYTLVGTPHYMAPEVILGKGYTTAVDIWALGVCFYEFVCGPLPFGNNAEEQLDIFRDILTGPLKFDRKIDKDAKDMIKRLLCRLPEVRLGCSAHRYKDIREHAVFSDFSFDRLMGRGYQAPLVPPAESIPAGTKEEVAPTGGASDTFDIDPTPFGKPPAVGEPWDEDF